MKIRIMGAMLIGLFLLAFVTSESKAKTQQEQIDELKQMVEENQKQNQDLQKKIQEMESQRAADQMKTEELVKEDEKKDEESQAFFDFIKSIKPSFYLDTSYGYNFNNPRSGTNSLRIFDTDHNDFNIHLFQLAFKKTPTTEGGLASLIGFGVKLDFGEDADIIGSSGLGDPDDEFDLQEAYIHVLAPVGNGLNIYAGKFVTLAGYELIESKDNPNFSRSFLFGFAIPFTHTGLRLNYGAGPVGLTLGVNNGWDNVDDNNDGKTIESQVSLSLGNASFYVTGYFGPEQDEVDSDWRELITVVGILTLMEKLTLVGEVDFGWEQGVTNADLGLDDDSVSWWGVAGYLIYDINDIFRLALRGEYFDDSDGFRTGTDQHLFEITPTLSIKPFCNKGMLDNLVLRFEYRFDHSNEDVFENDDSEFEDNQHTVATELLYYFSL